MKPFYPPVLHVGALYAISAEIFAARMASTGPQRLGVALTIDTWFRLLGTEIGATCRHKSRQAAVRFHVAAPTEGSHVVGSVVPRVTVAVMPIYTRLSTSRARPKLEKTPRPIALCVRSRRVAFPRSALGTAHHQLTWPPQIPSSTHRGIISECQRCHLRYDHDLHQRNARETRRSRKAAGDLF